MKKLIIGTMLVAAGWLLPQISAVAGSAVPHFLNYQSLLYDDGGNLIADGPATVTFRVSDSAENVLFEEHQRVDVVNGAVSALVGNGLDANGAPVGGIPFSVFTPDGARYLDVTVDAFPPESGMEIVSVPYAIYAEKALGATDESITSAALAKKSITMDHLADGLIGDLADEMSTGGLIATRTDLTNLQTTYRGTTGASSIGVTSGFVYSGSNNLQGVLLDLDRAIQHRQAGIETVQTSITNETTARIAGDTTLQTNLNTHANTNISTAHPNGYLPISRLGSNETTFINIATQAELDGEASTRSIADSAEASTRATADTAEAAARWAYDEDHENRLVSLEGKNNWSPINAWGSVTAGTPPIVEGYNASVTSVAFGYRISFIAPLLNANYAVSVTPKNNTLNGGAGVTVGSYITISDKTSDGFTVTMAAGASSHEFDFVVVGPIQP